jgi:trehalose-6-phosphate synthase
VANRLPISAKRDENTGEWNFQMSSGGLVTALQVHRLMLILVLTSMAVTNNSMVHSQMATAHANICVLICVMYLVDVYNMMLYTAYCIGCA